MHFGDAADGAGTPALLDPDAFAEDFQFDSSHLLAIG
jgi:hypothetical protein